MPPAAPVLASGRATRADSCLLGAQVRVPMEPGEVLLCDNYRVLHGRNVFKGDRYHAVSWFGGLVKDRPADFDDSNENSKPGDLLNKFVNKFLVDSF